MAGTTGVGRPSGEVLVVDGLTVDLGRRPVLRDVSLRVRSGELIGVLGPNGAGKTTLLRAVLGLVPRRSGRVELQGRPARRRRSGIGYVPQSQAVAWDFPLSVEQMVLTGRTGQLGLLRRPGVADWRAVDDALDRVGMAGLRRRPVGELSGGQRQRVLVARALAVTPALLLLDEPFTGLDLPTQDLLTSLLTDLSDEGIAVLMTTHDLLGAITTCSRLVLLNRTVIDQGPPERLRSPEPWMATFGVGGHSPLLRILEVL